MMKRVCSLLGFAQRAGQVASGEVAVEQAIRRRKALLVILATDASANTLKKTEALCMQRSVPTRQALTREQLGLAIGRSPRASVAILDSGFAGALAEALRGEEHGGG